MLKSGNIDCKHSAFSNVLESNKKFKKKAVTNIYWAVQPVRWFAPGSVLSAGEFTKNSQFSKWGPVLVEVTQEQEQLRHPICNKAGGAVTTMRTLWNAPATFRSSSGAFYDDGATVYTLFTQLKIKFFIWLVGDEQHGSTSVSTTWLNPKFTLCLDVFQMNLMIFFLLF